MLFRYPDADQSSRHLSVPKQPGDHGALLHDGGEIVRPGIPKNGIAASAAAAIRM